MGNRRTEIRIETERVLLVRSGSRPLLAWCARCGRKVEMLEPRQAVKAGRVSERVIYRWVEEGKLHFLESSDGELLICLKSLEMHIGPAPRPHQ